MAVHTISEVLERLAPLLGVEHGFASVTLRFNNWHLTLVTVEESTKPDELPPLADLEVSMPPG